jgi:hypothetical protein
MTPDFRILLAGPGIFHFAISSDSEGNACVRALPQDSASLIVTELNGDGTYQVKPNVQVLFKHGSVANPTPLVPPDCGCPAPPPPVQVASTKPPEPPPAKELEKPLLASTHMEMEAPLVFQAGSQEEEMEYAVARLRLTEGLPFADRVVLPPPPSPPITAAAKAPISQEKKGVFRKMRSFFASVFK